MGPPRHLWSGDWQLESAARAEELAARRGQAQEPAEAAEPVATPPPRRRWTQVLADRWRTARLSRRRQLRVATLVALVILLGAGAAYAVGSTIVGGGGKQPSARAGAEPWLGVDVANSPVGGVMVVRVFPGSPAQAAGIQPGDVITQIDTEPIAAPAILSAAISGLAPGDQVDIQLQRGPATQTVHVTLGSRPSG